MQNAKCKNRSGLRSSLLGAVLGLLSFAPARAQEPMTMGLQDCINYAMQHADTIKNARLNVLRQNAQNNQIKALALPHINGQVQYSYYPKPQQTLVPAAFAGGSADGYIPVQFVPANGVQVGIAGSQPLFDGSLLVALKARKTVMEAANQAAQLTAEGLKYQVQRAYFGVVIGQVQMRNLTASMAVARDVVHDQEVLRETGFAEKIDVDRSHVQLSNLETDSIRIGALLETGEQALKFIMGMEIAQPIILTDTALEGNLTEAAKLLTEQLEYARRTEYSLLSTVLRLDSAYLRRYQLAVLPTLALFANSGYNYGSNNFSDLTSFRQNYLFSTLVGVQLNVPIFNGFLRTNQVREAKINIERDKNNLHNLRLALDFQTANAQTTLKNALLAAEKQKRNLALSNTVLDLARRKFKAGVGSNFEVTQAQADLFLSQTNYYNALLDVVNAQADVQRALGGFRN